MSTDALETPTEHPQQVGVALPFLIGERVRIPSIGGIGWVEEINIGRHGMKFNVHYWLDSELVSVWLPFDELAKSIQPELTILPFKPQE